MPDYRSFEDEVENELQHMAGPEPPVDALNVARSVAGQAKQRSGPKMMTFRKVAAAGVVLTIAASAVASTYLDGDTSLSGVGTPAAEGPRAEPAEFQATWLHGPGGDESLTTSDEVGGVLMERNAEFLPVVAAAGDPRLGGDVSVRVGSDTFGVGGPSVTMKSFRIENEDGAWQERPAAIVGFPDTSGGHWTSTFDGEGDYEGLTAVAEVLYSADAGTWLLHGYIFDGDVPPAPEYPSGG